MITGGQTIFPNKSYLFTPFGSENDSGNPHRRFNSFSLSCLIVSPLITANFELSVAVRVGESSSGCRIFEIGKLSLPFAIL